MMKAGLVAAAAIALAASPARRPVYAPPEPCERGPANSLDSLLATGRFWHASRLLPAPAGMRALPAESVLIWATIAEGMGDHARVEALLRRARRPDSLAALVALAGRADERAERWRAAAIRYRRVLAFDSIPDALRQWASVRLASTLERNGERDSAVAAWRRASAMNPEVADWLAIRRAQLERDTVLAFAAVSGGRTPGARQRAELMVAQRRLEAGDRQAAIEAFRRYARPLDLARAEIAAGRPRTGRARADSILFADPARPNGFLAAVFLTEHFDSLTLAENLAVSRAYRARLDYRSAERFARQAVRGADSSVAAWLELALVLSLRKQEIPALRALDTAGARAGTRRASMVGAARVRALAQLGHADRADAMLDQLVRGSRAGDTSVARALLLRADRHRAMGERPQEVSRYLSLMRRFPEAPATTTAMFRFGLMRYIDGDRDSAEALVSSALRRDSLGTALGMSGRYWFARLRFERGDTASVTMLRRIADEAPISFHGTRARELLGDSSFVVDTVLDLPKLGSFPAARARERIRLLATLGLDAEARAEATAWATDSTASVQVLIAAAGEAGELGYARESIALGEAARARAGMVPGVARALFPYSFRQIIELEAAEHCIDPLLMAAIIRQESRFDPNAVSLVGAHGLSQIWTPTGREMTQRLRLGTFTPALLHIPDFNLHLGSQYVQDRGSRDSLVTHALIASYNAGQTRVRRWRRWPEYDDPDLFAERVFIPETQNYVRIVYASHAWYRAAWPATPLSQQERPLSPLP